MWVINIISIIWLVLYLYILLLLLLKTFLSVKAVYFLFMSWILFILNLNQCHLYWSHSNVCSGGVRTEHLPPHHPPLPPPLPLAVRLGCLATQLASRDLWWGAGFIDLGLCSSAVQSIQRQWSEGQIEKDAPPSARLRWLHLVSGI